VTAEIETKQIRTRVLLGFVRIAVLILLAVVIFRIAVPYLFNLHTNLGLFSAVAVGLFSLATLIWLAFDFITSVRRQSRP
jgi:hypothetical protein